MNGMFVPIVHFCVSSRRFEHMLSDLFSKTCAIEQEVFPNEVTAMLL